MAKDDLIMLDGVIKDAPGGGKYTVELENGTNITAKLCGKMKKFRIRVIIGDSVIVGVSPYDTSHGLIFQRK